MIFLIAIVYLILFVIVVGNLSFLRREESETSTPVRWPSVSVLVPARNEEDNLKTLLPSLLDQQYPSFEVIVYDDASEDATWDTLQSFRNPKLKALRGEGPPAGWVGKVHALYQATRSAESEVYLFLDADVRLEDEEALMRLVQRFLALPERSVLTGLTRLQGGGLLLVSLVPNAILSGLPWFLTERFRYRSLGALNGQCWMIQSSLYRRYEPHKNLPNEVLEDVQIGRYLKERSVTPFLVDLQDEVSVVMYRDFEEAWQGFRKNAYLMMGGTPLTFIPLFLLFTLVFVAAPFISLWFLLPMYLIKRMTDRISGFPLWISLLTPVAFLLSTMLQLHSALTHWFGRVSWKGRRVG